jgi:hypothetical protein
MGDVNDSVGGRGMTGRWARFGRGWAVAGFATYAAAFSHVVADGGRPPVIAIVLAIALSGPLCIALAGRLSRRRLASAVTASQFLYHGMFSLFGVAGTGDGAAITGAVGHHAHGAIMAPVAMSAPNASGLLPPDPLMVASHAVAAAVTVAVMLFANRTVNAALTAIRPILSLVDAGPRALRAANALASRPPRLTPRFTAQWRERLPLPDLAPLIGFLRHRGPPMAPLHA